MHGIQNAAGYDGFGLERYSQMVGRMKVWGELTDPDTTLRGDSREIDVTNVRYLLSMRRQLNSPGPIEDFAKADQQYGDYMFAANDLGLSSLTRGKRLSFSVSAVEIDHVALVSHLAWSTKSESLTNGLAFSPSRQRSRGRSCRLRAWDRERRRRT